MAFHHGHTEATEAALARLNEVSLGDEIDYEKIGRIVVASLLVKRKSGQPDADSEKIRATLEFAIRQREAGVGRRQAEICCVCWRDEFDDWNCYGSCCDIPPDEWL